MPSPRLNDPDFWAICFTVLSALVLLGMVIYAARIRGEFRRGKRRFVWSSDGWTWARGIVLLAMVSASCCWVRALEVRRRRAFPPQ